jgi:hypothetical protein
MRQKLRRAAGEKHPENSDHSGEVETDEAACNEKSSFYLFILSYGMEPVGYGLKMRKKARKEKQ